MHTAPVPRMGGLVMAAVVAAAALGLSLPYPVAISLLAAATLVCVSFLDDRRGLPVLLRLSAHLLAAVVAVSYILYWQKVGDVSGIADLAAGNLLLVALLAIGVAGMTNIFNFMDGSDGMAGGMALIGFGAYALAAVDNSAAAGTTMLAASISGAALGFLQFNFSPARIFMGDAGSIPLGFLAATLGLQGVMAGLWVWWFPLLVFSPFLVDAGCTLFFRLARLEPVWEAHRGHYYQRLILSGWSHGRTAICAYVLMLAATGSALVLRRAELSWGVILLGWMVLYGLLLLAMEWRLRHDKKDKTK